eukprot:8913438-Prorocentrum_lima.AAC.1
MEVQVDHTSCTHGQLDRDVCIEISRKRHIPLAQPVITEGYASVVHLMDTKQDCWDMRLEYSGPRHQG